MATSSTPEQNKPSERRVEDAPPELLAALDALNPTPRGFAALRRSEPEKYALLQGSNFTKDGLEIGSAS